jgi:hypothetical protein
MRPGGPLFLWVHYNQMNLLKETSIALGRRRPRRPVLLPVLLVPAVAVTVVLYPPLQTVYHFPLLGLPRRNPSLRRLGYLAFWRYLTNLFNELNPRRWCGCTGRR